MGALCDSPGVSAVPPEDPLFLQVSCGAGDGLRSRLMGLCRDSQAAPWQEGSSHPTFTQKGAVSQVAFPLF